MSLGIGAILATAAVLLRNGSPDEDHLVADGRGIYAQHCAECHGANLEGQADWRQPLPDGGLRAPPHDASGHTWHHPDEILFTITKFGGGAVAPPGFTSNMPPFEGVLSDHEISATLAFIASQWPPGVRERQQRLSQGKP